MRAALCKYAPFLKLMQAYGRFIAQLLVKQGKSCHRLLPEFMGKRDHFAGFFELCPIIGVDRKQRLASLDLIPHFVMDQEPHWTAASPTVRAWIWAT